MRFTAENAIPVKDRRRRRKLPRVSLIVGVVSVALAQASNANVLPLFPESWRAYIVGAGIMAFAFGLYEKAAQHKDGKRYLQRLHQDTLDDAWKRRIGE